MSEKLPECKTGENPPEANPKNEPAHVLFYRFVRSWPFIGGSVLVLGGGVWNYASSTMFAPYIIASGFCVLAFIIVHNLFPYYGRLVRYGIPGLLSCCLLLVTHLIVWIKETKVEFAVRYTWSSFSADKCSWFVEEYSPGYRRFTEVRGAALVEFTNFKTVPVMIAAYELRSQSTNGQWETIEAVTPNSLNNGKVFIGNDLKDVREIRYKTFDSTIENKEIAPNETVRGWIVFKNRIGQHQFVFRDTKTGKDFKAMLIAAASGFAPAQPLLIETITNHTDLSQVPRW